ncbi:hypothetical protein THASP1DRAFT_32703 [Thamnocephalis sphaerospora]|uniref:Swiss Army Knife 2H phosphoesterase domain-containing protein n=1 Tax=Thamnocephalis sphaerospora TaxID=78915 RepID=A0A4P9XID8_9FUNG|nr:hypothetical protein THASP1DRAFT_32703 [Thamnocephalis sphaerospora]|eukprot:RKP05455.1 hypothetical protein THASP1DRAFT_32703 [Thamnocephalis sphaerospora]
MPSAKSMPYQWPAGSFGRLALTATRLGLLASTVLAQSDSLWQPGLTLAPSVYNTSNVPFQPHAGPNPFDSYLQLTLDYKPVRDLFAQLVQRVPVKLQTRGEAHVTVVTPPEFDRVLKPAGVTMDEVNALAMQSRIQESRFSVECVGRARIPRPASPSVATNEKTEAVLADIVDASMDLEEAVYLAASSDNPLLLRDAPSAALMYASEDKPTAAPLPPYMEVYYVVVSSPDLLALRQRIERLFRTKGGAPGAFRAANFWPHITLGYTDRDLFVEDGIYKDRTTCWKNVVVTDHTLHW